MTGIFDQLTSANNNGKLGKQDNQEDNACATSINKDIKNISSPETTSQTLKQLKDVSQQLLKYGVLESTTKSKLYQTALIHQTKINDILEPLDLAVNIDDIRGLVFVVATNCDEEDEWSHPLVRRQRLNMEQSLLIAILRKHFVAHELESGVGDDVATVHLDELLIELNSYLGEMGSEIREDKRLRNLLEQLKTYSVVTEINEHEQVTIRPLIAHVANPENLKNLLLNIKSKIIQP